MVGKMYSICMDFNLYEFRPVLGKFRRGDPKLCFALLLLTSSFGNFFILCSHQTELEEAADLVLFLMDHTFLADDHLALNETTFTWPDRIIPIIEMR